jgi:hypothetical protein
VFLATGYQNLNPFLTRSNRLAIVPGDQQNDRELSTSLRYIRPLYRHVFALDVELPPTALSFVGLPIFVSNAITVVSQALVIGHAFANESLLPSREDMLKDLLDSEAALRATGLDPAYVGHRLLPIPGNQTLDPNAQYQENLVKILQEAGLGGIGTVPLRGQKFAEPWRDFARANGARLRNIWGKIEELGKDEVQKWVAGMRTEEDWEDMTKRLLEWGKRAYPETVLQSETFDFDFDYHY